MTARSEFLRRRGQRQRSWNGQRGAERGHPANGQRPIRAVDGRLRDRERQRLRAGADYVAQNNVGMVTFGAGETNKTITLGILRTTRRSSPTRRSASPWPSPAGPAPEVSTCRARDGHRSTIIENDFLTIVGAGVSVDAESIAPNNGRVDPGERTVTAGSGAAQYRQRRFAARHIRRR